MRFNLWYLFGKRRGKSKALNRTKKNTKTSVNEESRKVKIPIVTDSQGILVQRKNKVISKTKVNTWGKEKAIAVEKASISPVNLAETKNLKGKRARASKGIKKEKAWGGYQRNAWKTTTTPWNG